MDYKKLAADLLSGCEENCSDCEYAGDSEFECTIAQLAAAAITDLLLYKDAVDRMGAFWKLFVAYNGDLRGPVGRAGDLNPKEESVIMPVLTDVDGGKWRPVNEDVLRDLFARAEAAEAAEARCKRLDEELKAHSETDFAKAHEVLSADWAKQKKRAEAAEERAEKAEKEVEQYRQFLQNWHEHEDG